MKATVFCAFAFHDEIIANGTRVIMVELNEARTGKIPEFISKLWCYLYLIGMMPK